MRTLARAGDTEPVVGTVPRTVRVADEVPFVRIPDLSGLAIIEPHGQVAALVFERLDPVLGAQEDALLVEGTILVCEDDAFCGDLVEVRESFHASFLPGGIIHLVAMTDTLVIFAREPVPGKVKTRLAAGVGVEAAAEIYRSLLDHTVETSLASGVEVFVSLAREPDREWVDGLGLPFEVQGGGDLGERMVECFARRFSNDGGRTVIIGSDNARLRPDHIRSAFAALEDHPVVLGPAEDGGYWLVGQRRPGVDLFSDIPWSAPNTLDATRDRLKALKTPWRELETLPDIDTEEDLQKAINDPKVDEELRRRLHAAL